MELRDYLDYAHGLADDFHRRAANQLTRYPVAIREFVESPEFLNDTSVYAANMKALEELNNPDRHALDEAVFDVLGFSAKERADAKNSLIERLESRWQKASFNS